MKLREFWITEPDNFYNSGSVGFNKTHGSPYENTKTIHVREVSSELDDAIQKIIEALKFWAKETEWINVPIEFQIKRATEALEAWRKVNE